MRVWGLASGCRACRVEVKGLWGVAARCELDGHSQTQFDP